MVGWGRVSPAVVAVVVAGLAGGCREGAGPSPSPSVSSSSVSPSGSAATASSPSVAWAGPPTPQAARQRTPAGAEAFVRFFFEQYNHAWTTPAPGLIAGLSDPRCELCDKGEETSRTLASRGDRYDSPPVTVRAATSLRGAPEPQAYVLVDLIQNTSRVISSTGEVVHTDPREDIPSNVALVWTAAGWRVLGVDVA